MTPIIEPSTTLKAAYPKHWLEKLPADKTVIHEFRNLQHFKNYVSTLTQKEDKKCGVPYNQALTELLSDKPLMSEGDYQIIKNRVKNNLHKRGLIADTLYESYKYDVEGEFMDVAKLAEGDPACFLVPNESYTNHFYELYISVSYHCGISDSTVVENMAKILATVQLLEREHYYCKITLIFPAVNSGNSNVPKRNYFSLVPLFSHKDIKTIQTMSSVLNERLLRKFYFAVLEDVFKDNISGGYGQPIALKGAIIPVDLDECDLHAKIMEQIITPCSRR